MKMLALSPRPAAPIPGPRTPSLVMDEATFEAWLKAAHPGSRITLHRGHLSVDREKRPDAADAHARAELNRLADRAMRASGQGLVHLVQKRHGDADYSYIAIRARAPAKRRGDSFSLSNRRRTT